MSQPAPTLFVSNLPEGFGTDQLREVFSTFGAIHACQVLPDTLGQPLGIVSFVDQKAASAAIQVMNGFIVFDKPLKVMWATAQALQTTSEQPSDASPASMQELPTGFSHLQLFVGDLAPDIDEAKLLAAFARFNAASARVMWDATTGRSRGYGFVTFTQRDQAERALREMNGHYIGQRAVRCNWASLRHTAEDDRPNKPQDWHVVAKQTPDTNCTVYVGNLPTDVSEHQLQEIFAPHGAIEEIRMQRGQGFAFVTYRTHDYAARAIVSAAGMLVGGRFVRTSWGRERTRPVAGEQPDSPLTGSATPPHYGSDYPRFVPQSVAALAAATTYSQIGSHMNAPTVAGPPSTFASDRPTPYPYWNLAMYIQQANLAASALAAANAVRPPALAPLFSPSASSTSSRGASTPSPMSASPAGGETPVDPYSPPPALIAALAAASMQPQPQQAPAAPSPSSAGAAAAAAAAASMYQQFYSNPDALQAALMLVQQSPSATTNPYAATLAAQLPAYYSAYAAALAQEQASKAAATSASGTDRQSPPRDPSSSAMSSSPPPDALALAAASMASQQQLLQQRQLMQQQLMQQQQQHAVTLGPVGSRVGSSRAASSSSAAASAGAEGRVERGLEALRLEGGGPAAASAETRSAGDAGEQPLPASLASFLSPHTTSS